MVKDPRMSDKEAAAINAAAAVKNYTVKPHLDYRTVSGINGPVSSTCRFIIDASFGMLICCYIFICIACRT